MKLADEDAIVERLLNKIDDNVDIETGLSYDNWVVDMKMRL